MPKAPKHKASVKPKSLKKIDNKQKKEAEKPKVPPKRRLIDLMKNNNPERSNVNRPVSKAKKPTPKHKKD